MSANRLIMAITVLFSVVGFYLKKACEILRLLVKTSFFLSVYVGLSGVVLADETWIPAEFKALMQVHCEQLNIYYGQQLLGTYEVSVRPGALRVSHPEMLLAALADVALDKKLALAQTLAGWQSSHVNLQCDADDISHCSILKAEQVGFVLDEPRLRLRLFFPKRYLKKQVAPLKKKFLPDANQQGISSVHMLQLAVSGDNQHQNYNLTGDSIVGKGEYNLEGQWHQAASVYETSDFSVDQLVLRHDARGRTGRLGLINNQQLSVWDSFRTMPHPGMWGVSWGSSSTTLLNKSSDSATPLPVYLPAAGRVEVYRDGRLLSTQTVSVGNSLLDTDALPNGVYELELRGVVGSILVFSERRVFVKSSWLPADGEGDMGFRLGWMTDNDASAQHALQGSLGWSKRVASTQAIKAGAFLTPHWQHLEMGMMGVWPLNYNLSLVADPDQLGSELSLSGSVDKLYGYLETRYYHSTGSPKQNPFINTPDKSLMAGVSYQLLPHHMLTYRYYYQYAQQLYTETYVTSALKSISHEISYNMNYPLGHKLQMNASLGENFNSSGDSITYFNIGLAYIDDYQVNLNQRMQQNNRHNQQSTTLSAHWNDIKPSWLERANYSADVAYTDEKSSVGVGMNFDSSHLAGNATIRHDQSQSTNQGETSYYGNVKTALVSDEQANFGWGKGEYGTSTGVLVDLAKSTVLGTMDLLVDDNIYTVNTGKMNWIPLKPYHTYTIRLRDNNRGSHLFNITGHAAPQTLYPGNVVRLAYHVEEDEVLFGILDDEQGKPITHAVMMGRFQSRLDNGGQFQVRVPRYATQLMARQDNGSYCTVKLPARSEDRSFHSVGVVICKPTSVIQAKVDIDTMQMAGSRINRS